MLLGPSQARLGLSQARIIALTGRPSRPRKRPAYNNRVTSTRRRIGSPGAARVETNRSLPPSLLGRISWCPHVNRDERAEFERRQRERGLVDYSIKTWAMTGPSSPSPERDEFFPVLYSTTASKLPATLGMDLNSEPARSQAIQRARDGNMMATAQNVLLRNPIGGDLSTIAASVTRRSNI
jgi:hypothetical protein